MRHLRAARLRQIRQSPAEWPAARPRWRTPRWASYRVDPPESPLLKRLADIGAVVAVPTALLYYFGWVRTRFQARELGFDVSAMHLTTTDYVLKSLNVLFLPLVILTVAALILHHLHRTVILPTISGRPRWIRRCAWLFERAWIPTTGVAILLSLTPLNGYAIPVTLSVALLCACYGRTLRRAVDGADPWPPTTKVIVLALLALALFWTTERVARTAGKAYGADLLANPTQLPAVTIYSVRDLGLDIGRSTRQTALSGTAAFTFRYDGLRLLERSGDQFFFITDQPVHVIVLPENDDIRMEFTRSNEGT